MNKNYIYIYNITHIANEEYACQLQHLSLYLVMYSIDTLKIMDIIHILILVLGKNSS